MKLAVFLSNQKINKYNQFFEFVDLNNIIYCLFYFGEFALI